MEGSLVVRTKSAVRKRWSRLALRSVPDHALFDEFTRRVPLTGLEVRGQQGTFLGSASDRSIVYTYATTQTWAGRTLDCLYGYFSANPGSHYLDIGANIGLTSIPIATRGIATTAFEPEPDNFRFLTWNMARNGVRDLMTAHNLALSDKAETLQLEISPQNKGDHRLRKSSVKGYMGEDAWPVVEVEARRLDEVVAASSTPLAIKLDAQGAEPLIISGGRRVFSQADLVILEFSPYAMARMGNDPSAIFEFVRTRSQVQLAFREDEAPGEPIRGSDACETLDRFYNENLDRPTRRYMDVIVR